MDNKPGYYIIGPQEDTLAPPAELTIEHNIESPRGNLVPDLRISVADFLGKYGQMLLVQRMNMKIHCMFCWHDKLGEPDPQCPYCLGRGYLSIFERHISRKTSALNAHRLQLLAETPTGPQAVDELYWYFEYNANPQIEDMIYEVSWADPQQLVIKNLLYSYRINYSYSYRGNAGRIEYWRTSTRSRPVDEVIKERNLRVVTNISLQIPDDGIIRYVVAAE